MAVLLKHFKLFFERFSRLVNSVKTWRMAKMGFSRPAQTDIWQEIP